jgi:hypothetical protein
MALLGMILAAVLVAVLVAYLVVKFLPLNLRWIVSILLLVLTVFLGSKIYNGIMKPIEFNKTKKVKFAKIVESLKIIRDAEIKYYEATGRYTKDKSALISFIDTAKLALTETKTIVIKVNKGSARAPIMVDEEKRVTDTTGYEPVIKYFEGRNYKNMFKVPGLEGQEFDIQTGEIEKVQGLRVPTFEAKVEKKLILAGMDNSLVKQELERIETDEIKGEYISVGSLNEVSTNGNWPPFYDKADRTGNKD